MITSAECTERLEQYLDRVGELLGRRDRRAVFATYIVGLMSSIDRKNAETIAAMSCPDQRRAGSEHQKLLNVVGNSPWSDEPLRQFSARYALEAQERNGEVAAWVVDDTGWPKKGTHSVGVQRQYSGTLGKVDNCQIGVSVVATTATTQVPLDFSLYLPRSWIDDRARRKTCKIPEDTEFKTKPELALDMIRGAINAGFTKPRIVLADAGYGNSATFRHEIRSLGLHFGVGIGGNTKLWRLDVNDLRRGPPTTAENLGAHAKLRRVTWADGTKGPMASRFAFYRVRIARDEDHAGEPPPVWLVIERPYHEGEAIKYHLTSLPATTSHRKIAWHLHQRWRTERVYEDMKQEFGLDHYEGRSFVGWNHHVTAVMVCYNFTAAEQARLFPPAEYHARHAPALESAA